MAKNGVGPSVGSVDGGGAESDKTLRLRQRHDELERRLAELERHLSLTPEEQIERSQLKKEKLRTKDELRRLGALRAP
jgi:uncharacterized protein YdcH (DUF465 family)